VCSGPQCERAAVTGGLCSTHYMQVRSGHDLTPIRQYKPKGMPCEVDGCARGSVSEGLCRTHYGRRLAGDPDWQRPIPAKGVNGSGHTDAKGYRQLTRDGRRVQEHVVVMEGLLGRRLHPHENVHHVNGQRADNRTDGPLRVVGHELRSGNLELWSKTQPAGQRVPDKIDYALTLLETYLPHLSATQRARLGSLFG
jgi:hypothetical protein